MRPHRRQPTRLPPCLGFSRQEHCSGLPFPSQCMKVKRESETTQSCLTVSDPMDCSLLGSSVHGIFQARVLEWGAIAFSQFKMKLLIFFSKLALPTVILQLMATSSFRLLRIKPCESYIQFIRTSCQFYLQNMPRVCPLLTSSTASIAPWSQPFCASVGSLLTFPLLYLPL